MRSATTLNLKPSNILLTSPGPDCEPLVCDFGLAKDLNQDFRKTSQGMGSYAYIAPELIAGTKNDPEPKPSKTTDQYSLAISYFELRTGSLPFKEFEDGVLQRRFTRAGQGQTVPAGRRDRVRLDVLELSLFDAHRDRSSRRLSGSVRESLYGVRAARCGANRGKNRR